MNIVALIILLLAVWAIGKLISIIFNIYQARRREAAHRRFMATVSEYLDSLELPEQPEVHVPKQQGGKTLYYVQEE